MKTEKQVHSETVMLMCLDYTDKKSLAYRQDGEKGNRMFKYGMKLRPFSIECQPMYGLVRIEEDNTGKYWNILYYTYPLNDHEQDCYELDYLGEEV